MNMFIVFFNNLKRSFNNKTTFLLTTLVPILVVILGIFANYVSKPSFNIGILNGNYSSMSQNVVSTIDKTDGINTSTADKDSIQRDIISGKFSAVIDFSKENQNFAIYTVKDEKTKNNLEQLVNTYISNPTPIDISTLQESSLGITQRTVTFIVMFLMITSTVTSSLIIRDKNEGTYTRFMYSPQNKSTYLAGNILFSFVISYLQFFIAIFVIKLFKMDIGIIYQDLLLMGLWVVAISTSFGVCICSLFDNEMYANLSSSCIALVLSLIGGTFISFDKMPTMLQHISAISPIRWFVDVTTYLEQGNSWFSNSGYIVILTLFVVVFSLISILVSKNSKCN